MNPAAPRRKRVSPQRQGPVRNRFVPPSKVNGVPPPGANPASAAGDLLECGVRTAYTVIDEYLRRGYEAAREFRNPTDGRGDMQEEKRNYNDWSNWANMWGPMAFPIQQWMAMMRAWANAWSGTFPAGWAQMGNMPWPGFMPGAFLAPVSVELSAQKAAQVTASVSLYPGAECQPLSVGPLIAEGGKNLLRGVSVSHTQGSVRVSVTVPADQASGTYVGDIKAPDTRVVGSLIVVLAATGTP